MTMAAAQSMPEAPSTPAAQSPSSRFNLNAAGRTGSIYYTYGNPGYDKTGGGGDWTYINWRWCRTEPDHSIRRTRPAAGDRPRDGSARGRTISGIRLLRRDYPRSACNSAKRLPVGAFFVFIISTKASNK
jgi:hypothetical protein